MKDFLFVVRILRRNPLIFLVNMTGMGLALTTVILTITYIRYELSYDKHFTTRNRVVRLYSRVTDNTSTEVYGISLRQAYTQLPGQVPEVEAAVQLYGGWSTSVQTKEKIIGGTRIFYADESFFKVFGLKLKQGNANTALSGVNNAVITTTLAEKLFNSADCVGKTIESDGEQAMITGIIDDLPKNSHFSFDVLISLPTLPLDHFGGLEFQTYYLLKPNIDQHSACAKISAANNVLMRDWAKATNSKVQSGVEALDKLYLHSAASQFIPNHGSPEQILIVGLIALFVLLTALVSYINLFIIQGEKRIAEISTRTMFGASKLNIARLFFIETSIVFILSTGVAFLVTYTSMPFISALLMSKVALADLFSIWGILSVFMVLILLLLITSGYPVFYLSRMKYILALRGKVTKTGGKNYLSNASVLVQFIVTVFFISCVVIIISQIRYMQNVPKGFTIENVYTLTGFSPRINKSYGSVKNELLKLPFISGVSGGEHFMGGGCSGQYIRNTWEGDHNDKVINEYREKPGFGEVMQLQLVDGRFPRESMADSLAIVLNVSATKLLGLRPKAGQTVLYNDERVEIIGIVKDFYYNSNPGEEIKPIVIANCYQGNPNIYLRSREPLTKNEIEQIKSVIHRFDENAVFRCQALSDVFEEMYKKEKRLAKLASLGALQVVLISLISLLALSILKISRRTKEIGIRKVLGSTVIQVITGLLKETLIIVSVAVLIASALSYYVMHRWLADYAERIHLHPGFFIFCALFAYAIAILATIGQSWYAAVRNPVDAIKHE